MRRFLSTTLALVFATLSSGYVFGHCEVPCGIYADQMRFEQMLEDQKTIAKAIAQIGELASKSDAQSVNQTVRWINTKEAHATKTQDTIAQYFMTQRIKPGEGYVKKLTTAHAVMVAAMNCKQSTDPATAAALQNAILDFYRAYDRSLTNRCTSFRRCGDCALAVSLRRQRFVHRQYVDQNRGQHQHNCNPCAPVLVNSSLAVGMFLVLAVFVICHSFFAWS